jgi:hypothetical protein
MTNTRLSDVIVPEVFQKYMIRETAEKARVFQAGIMQNNAVVAAFLAGGGRTVNLPHWSDLYTGSTTDNISSDDETVVATTTKMTATKDLAIRHNRNQGWSSSDLTAALAGDDPLKMVSSRIGTYWANQFDKMVVSVLRGIVADNIAANSGDMVKDSTGSTITADLIIDAAATMGDADDRLAAIIMHSKTYARLAKLNLIDFIPDSDGKVRFPSYLGYAVVRDDDCYQNGTITHTYLVARDAFAWGEGTPNVPVEVDRFPAQGNGGGVEQIWSRREFCLHPYGYQWAIAAPGSGMVGQSPTDAEMQAATAWTRVAPRKNVGIAALITNL